MRVPIWITAKFASACHCGKQIAKGDRILFHPASRTAECKECGDQHQRNVAADNFDLANNGVL